MSQGKAHLCDHHNAKCIDSRPRKNGYRSRRYHCLDCGHRWSTIEVPIEESRSGLKMSEALTQQMDLLTQPQWTALENLIAAFIWPDGEVNQCRPRSQAG